MSGGDERKRPYTQITDRCQIREPGQAPVKPRRGDRCATVGLPVAEPDQGQNEPMTRLLPALLLTILLPVEAAHAAPQADLWPRWERHDPAATETVDTGSWAAFLARYVALAADGITRVDYGAVTSADRTMLQTFLADMAAVPVSTLNRDEQLAYWINLYNALAVEIVLAHYPVASVRDIDISPGLFAQGPWGKKLATVEGEAVSLDDIEHRILRPIWRDPRVHYAVNCAALGCPNLQPVPYAAKGIDHTLDQAARAYVNHPRGMWIDAQGLHVSSIYIWFEEDFGGSEAGIIRHLLAYAAPETAMRLQEFTEIASDRYDWTLNDARLAP